jgi:hypothetical protein
MLVKKADKSIYITRGDAVEIPISVMRDGALYRFKRGDFVRFKVFERGKCENVVLKKDTEVLSDTDVVFVHISGSDTKIGALIDKPVDYWYEVEVNPNTEPDTIIGYDASGPKIFRLYPEGGESEGVGGGELPSDPLYDAVAAALKRAKDSGLFDGKDGEDGKDGYTPQKGVDYFDGDTPQKGVDYFDGKDGYTPKKGEDYFTAEDKAEIVSAVLAGLPQYTGEVSTDGN